MSRPILAVLSCLALLFVAHAPATAQEKPSRIVVVLSDGTSVAGELVEATPAGVTLRASPKTEPVMRPWSKIKRVSTGLTRAQVVQTWRATRKDELCEACTGDGHAACKTCDGKGVTAASVVACAACEGSGTTGPCKTPRCDGGQIPCPQPCLKKDSFTGPPDADGKRWRQFRGKSGTMRISEGHVGELVVIEKGDPVNKGKCPTCDGTTRLTDAACSGTGKAACKPCRGHGVTGDDCPNCEDGKAACDACAGSGMRDAPSTQPAG